MAKNDTPEIPDLLDDLPEEAPQEQIAKISLWSWRTHLASVRTLDKRIEKLIDEAVKQALAQGRKLTSADIGRVFQRHPELRAALDKTMQKLNDDLTATIEQGSKDAWLRANTAADAVVAAMANNNAQLAALLNDGQNKPQNDRALRAFQQREMQGLKLSDRVWRATEGMKLDMERAVEVSLAEGVPAQKLSERVRELLKEPHRLYRRVRDKGGNLRLSQAAQKYHPGTGVYRSSYKNAMRVARTEVNMAYQASDSERWTRSWWVKGIRVSLSNNHTSPDSKGRPAPLVDICDDLAGDYPADFKFTGWHPQCRCFATAITCKYTDIRDYYRRKRAGEDMTGYTPPGAITEPPKQFTDWVTANKSRLSVAAKRGTTPYFIANNAKYTDPNWKPSKATASADHRQKTPLEIADEGQQHVKKGNYGAAMKFGAAEQKLGQKVYAHAAVTIVSESQKENIAEVADLLGIRRKKIKPMDFNKADNGMGNVDFGNGKAFADNCPATIAAHEARLRGLNVTALGFNEKEPVMVRIRKRFQEIWIDPATGNAPTPKISGIQDYNKKKKWTLTDDEIIEKAESLMQAPGRYHIGINQLNGKGHVIVAERMADGTLICFDSQAQVFKRLSEWSNYQYIEILKIDDLIFNAGILSKIVRKI